jgi:hypothetical protein
MPELAPHSTPFPNSLPPSLLAIPLDDPPSSPSSPPATTQSGGQGSAIPLIIDPAAWEDYPVFRESFLMYVTEPKHNAALRAAGEFLFTMVLEHYGNWPSWTESPTRTELRAAVADMRHLEGFIGSVGREHRLSSLSSEDTALSQSAARVAVEVGKLADGLSTS